MAKLQARKLIASCAQCLGTVLLKDEELARFLEYGKKQLLLTVVTLILTWLRELSNWCRPIFSCQLTSAETLTEH